MRAAIRWLWDAVLTLLAAMFLFSVITLWWIVGPA